MTIEKRKLRRIRLFARIRAAGKQQLSMERALREQRVREAGERLDRNAAYLENAGFMADLLADQALRVASSSREIMETESRALQEIEGRISSLHAAQSRLEATGKEMQARIQRSETDAELADILGLAVVSGMRGSQES